MARWVGLCALVLVVPIAAAAPEQVHVSQTAEGTVVGWALPGDTRSLPPGHVAWGPIPSIAPGEWVGHVDATPYVGTSSSGIVRDMAEAPATLYRATLPPQPPGTTIRYRVVDGAGVPSATYTTTTLPGRNSALHAVLYGDQGTTEDGASMPPRYRPVEVTQLALAQDPDVVVVAGDLSYAEEAALRWWNDWFDIIEPLAATRPFYAAVGNHDRDFVTGYDQWAKRFHFPGDEQNYAFDAGPVHFLVLNSQEACLEGETTETVQRVNPNCTATTASGAPVENTAITDFARADLANARARGMPWSVVVYHHPPYSHGSYNESDSGTSYMFWMREHWLPIFEEHGVDLVVAGHDHDYQRTWPILDGIVTSTRTRTTEGTGIVYVTTGGGGRPPYALSPPPDPAWFATGASVHHVVVLDATATKLKVQAIGLDGEAFDAFEVRKAGGPSTHTATTWLALAALAGVAARHAGGAWRRARDG